MDGAWVVLRSQPQREVSAANAVAAQGVESYVPLLPGRPRPVRGALLFPGYLFARAEPETDEFLRIRSAPGIAYVLPRGAPPARLPDSFISLLRRRVVEPRRPLQRGDRVVIQSEPFRWLEANFDRRLSARGRVLVLLELVHRIVVLNVDESELKRAG